MKNNISQNKTKATNIKKSEVRNPKGRGADLFKIEMSFGDVMSKLIPSAKK